MENECLVNQYNFHGHPFSVTGEANIISSVHSRMNSFFLAEHTQPKLTFSYRFCSEKIGIASPQGKSRRLFDSPMGSLLYFVDEDKLYMNMQNAIYFLSDFKSGHTEITYNEKAQTIPWLLTHTAFTIPFVDQIKRLGLYPLHAAGMAFNNKGVLFPGDSGAGKSTLTVALLREGFGFLSDDTTFLKRDDRGITMLAFPDEIDVTQQTINFFPELSNRSISKHIGAPKYQVDPEIFYPKQLQYVWECAPKCLVFPNISKDDHSSLEMLDKEKAFLELGHNVLLTEPKASQAHFDILTDLVNHCDCYELQTGRDFAELGKLIRGLL